MTKTLAQTLEDLKNVSADFNTVVENLFEFRFEDYNQVFKINELDIPPPQNKTACCPTAIFLAKESRNYSNFLA